MNTLCSFVSNNFLNDASLLEKLGSGTYGKVYRIQKPNGQRFAVKYIKTEDNPYDLGVSQNILLETDALIRLRGVPDVIYLIGVCYQANEVALILEHMDLNLRQFIKRTPIEQRIALVPKVLFVMARSAALFETLNIIHFDVKPENILVRFNNSDIEFKITDFGLSYASFLGHTPEDEVYTIWYRPPEFLAGRDRRTFRIYAGDIWAIGATIVEFIIGSPLFPGKGVQNTLNLIYTLGNSRGMTYENFVKANQAGTIIGGIPVRNLLSEQQLRQIDPAIIEILERMLSLNPIDRPSAIQIYKAFGERINPDFLMTLIPPVYPRRVNARGIYLIIAMGTILNVSKASLIIIIELFTRYLDLVDIDLRRESNIDIHALAAFRIGVVYNGDNVITQNIRVTYSQIVTNPNTITNLDIANMEKRVLHTIDFHIYNISLTPVIERAYINNVDLTRVDLNKFVEPLDRWFQV